MSTRRPACLQFPAPHRSDSTQPRQMSVCAFGAHTAPPPMERTRKQRRRTSGGHDRSPPSEGRQCRRRAASREHSKGRLICRLCSSLICRSYVSRSPLHTSSFVRRLQVHALCLLGNGNVHPAVIVACTGTFSMFQHCSMNSCTTSDRVACCRKLFSGASKAPSCSSLDATIACMNY